MGPFYAARLGRSVYQPAAAAPQLIEKPTHLAISSPASSPRAVRHVMG